MNQNNDRHLPRSCCGRIGHTLHLYHHHKVFVTTITIVFLHLRNLHTKSSDPCVCLSVCLSMYVPVSVCGYKLNYSADAW